MQVTLPPSAYKNLPESAQIELVVVLRALVAGAHESLTSNLVGVYLLGSFALGQADLYSDVDFLVITRHTVTDGQFAALARLHRRLPGRGGLWAQHLEGSYASADELRSAPAGGGWPYVDNGSPTLERSDHDDTLVTRWVLREHGIMLAGVAPTELLDPVPAAELQREARTTVRQLADYLGQRADAFSNAWGQPFYVLTLCRALYTYDTGSVAGKQTAANWALVELDPQWRPLIERAIADRPDPWLRVQRKADAELAAPSWAFLRYATDRVQSQGPAGGNSN